MKLLPILLFLIALPAYSGESHHHEPATINVPDDGSNHNALLLGAVIIGAVCWYHQCWKPKPVKTTGSIVPETPKNEYTDKIIIRQKQ